MNLSKVYNDGKAVLNGQAPSHALPLAIFYGLAMVATAIANRP